MFVLPGIQSYIQRMI